MDIDERSTKLYTITQDLHPDFQAHGFTIKEIENAAVLYKFLSSLLIKLNTR